MDIKKRIKVTNDMYQTEVQLQMRLIFIWWPIVTMTVTSFYDYSRIEHANDVIDKMKLQHGVNDVVGSPVVRGGKV